MELQIVAQLVKELCTTTHTQKFIDDDGSITTDILHIYTFGCVWIGVTSNHVVVHHEDYVAEVFELG